MNRQVLLIGAIVAAVLVGYFGLVYHERVWTPEKLPYFDFVHLTENDLSVTRKNVSGRWSVINFWASWCDVCELEKPLINSLSSELNLIGVVSNDSRQNALLSGKWQQRPYIHAVDPNGELLDNLRFAGVPATVLVNPAGEIVFRVQGRMDKDDVAQILALTSKKNL